MIFVKGHFLKCGTLKSWNLHGHGTWNSSRHSNDKGDWRVWLEEYGASAIGARLYAATAGFKLEDGDLS